MQAHTRRDGEREIAVEMEAVNQGNQINKSQIPNAWLKK